MRLRVAGVSIVGSGLEDKAIWHCCNFLLAVASKLGAASCSSC